MLPDFVKVRKPIAEAVTHTLRQLIRQRPLIGAIQQEYFFEGHAWGAFGEDVDDGRHGFREIQTPSAVPTKELIERGPEALLSRLPELAAAMADQIEKRMLDRIVEAASEGGGKAVVQADMPETFDAWLDNLKALEIDFDSEGAPILPMMVGSGALLARLKSWESDPDNKTKLEAVLRAKREEFDAREGNRTLAD
jgi:hypothetical protein